MTKRRRHKSRTVRQQSLNAWLRKNPHLVKWGMFAAAIASIVVTVWAARHSATASISADQLFSVGPISGREECTQGGWFFGEEHLYGFTVRNTGEDISTISYATITEVPSGNSNIDVWATTYFFTSAEEYLSTINQLEGQPVISQFFSEDGLARLTSGVGGLRMLPVNLFDIETVNYSIPLTVEPGTSRTFVIKIWITITVRSGDPYDLLSFRGRSNEWRLDYEFATNEGLVRVPVVMAQVPRFGDLITCPPGDPP